MAAFKPTVISTAPRYVPPGKTSSVPWSRILLPHQTIQDFGSVVALETNPIDDDEFLVTSQSRLFLHSISEGENKRHFQTHAPQGLYSGTYRPGDGKLIACGTKEGKLRLFDAKQPRPLRYFGDDPKTVHSDAVRRVCFSDAQRIVSFSDDQTIKVWNVLDSKLLQTIGNLSVGPPAAASAAAGPSSSFYTAPKQTYAAHDGYVRAGCVTQDGLIVSGGSDCVVKVWDPRENSAAAGPTHSFLHGSPLSYLTMRSPTMITAVGGRTINEFDLIAGRNLESIPEGAMREITCAQWIKRRGDNYLITTSLDGFVSIREQGESLVASFSYTPKELLCCTASAKSLCVGDSDGNVYVRKVSSLAELKLQKEIENAGLPNQSRGRSGSGGSGSGGRYFQNNRRNSESSTTDGAEDLDDQDGGEAEDQDDKDSGFFSVSTLFQNNASILVGGEKSSADSKKRPAQQNSAQAKRFKWSAGDAAATSAEDMQPTSTVVRKAGVLTENAGRTACEKLTQFDKYLKKWEFSLALNACLANGSARPHFVVSQLQELLRRSAFKVAVAGRTAKELRALIKFICSHIRNPRFSRTLLDIARQLCAVYGMEGPAGENSTAAADATSAITPSVPSGGSGSAPSGTSGPTGTSGCAAGPSGSGGGCENSKDETPHKPHSTRIDAGLRSGLDEDTVQTNPALAREFVKLRQVIDHELNFLARLPPLIGMLTSIVRNIDDD